jgi:hypothetical protein
MKRKQRRSGKPAPPDRFDHPSQRRPVDSHREWAAVSLPVLKVSSSVRGRPGPFDPFYTLGRSSMWLFCERPSRRSRLADCAASGSCITAEHILPIHASESRELKSVIDDFSFVQFRWKETSPARGDIAPHIAV